jgi:hypothetical protein
VDKQQTRQHASSFRDPAGFVFEYGGSIYRQVNRDGADDYDHFISSGLYQKLVDEKLIVGHKEVSQRIPVPITCSLSANGRCL